MATITNKTLVERRYIANSKSTLYTNPSATLTHIRGIEIHNLNTTAENVVLYEKAGST